MSTENEQNIAKEIVIKMIENKLLRPSEHPEAKTLAEAIGKIYNEILNAISKS